MKELTEEQLEAVKECFKSQWNIQGFESKLKEKGLIKEELEVGKWYKYSDSEGHLFCITKVETDGVEVYGFNSWGNWIDEGMYSSKNLIPATDQEVNDALIKEAKNRGFKEGVIVDKSNLNHFVNNNPHVLHREYSDLFEYRAAGKNYRDVLFCCGTCIFEDGKWAEIIEEKKERTIEQIEKELGYLVKIVK